MMYPFMTLNDDTEIVHSELRSDGQVKVYIETPCGDHFHDATCYLPGYRWENIHGYTEEEMKYFRKLVEDTAHVIWQCAQEGGILSNAAAV